MAKNFEKLKGKVDNYVGSISGDLNDISDKVSGFVDNLGTGKNLSNLFDQRIADGLDDLISGALGFRISNIPEISNEVLNQRETNRANRQKMFDNLAEASASGEDEPPRSTLYRYPENYKTASNEQINFPNYIHFRSLKRRHEIGRSATPDGLVVDGKPSAVDADTELFDIFLHLPENLVDNLQVTYSESENDVLSNIIGTLFGNTSDVAQNSSFDKKQIKEQILNMLPGAQLRQLDAGTTINPLKYQSFSGVPFRTYQYTFTFRPKNAIESQTIRNVISAFKRSMLPGVQGVTSRLYTFPNEWAIEFDGPISNWVDFPLTSVCTGCDVDYSGGGGYIATHDGASTAVTMSLSFTETVPLHRKRFMEQVSAANPNRQSKAAAGTDINKIEDPEKADTKQEGPAAEQQNSMPEKGDVAGDTTTTGSGGSAPRGRNKRAAELRAKRESGGS